MEQKQNKVAKNRLGYISKSKDGKSTLLTVEQDMVLKAGDRLILKKPSDEVESLAKNGVISEEKKEQLLSKLPAWKMSVVNLLPRSE